MNPFVAMLIQNAMNSPMIRNNPNAQQWLQVVQSGDAKAGEQIAKNICASYGMTPEQATQQAQQGLFGMFGGKR